MTILPNMRHSQPICSLDTFRHVAAASSMYKVSVDISEVPPSGLSIVIQQNGSTKASSAAPSSSQIHVPLDVVLNCAANDNIDVIVTSSVAGEAGINLIKGSINIHQGST